ncbi:MAG: hypothetical protein JW862_12195 [Anaerolineales bacterium]|nr:hypothetical protein [Anaerolineales bacterium]
MAEQKPKITIGLVAGPKRARASQSLQSVLNQDGIAQAEVLLYDTRAADFPPLPESQHPLVRDLGQRPYRHYGDIRAEMVRQARGELIAFLEEHAFAHPGWLPAIIQALDGDWAGVGPEVHNPYPDVGISNATQLMNYTTWRHPAKRQVSELLPGQNSAYRRDVLLAFGDELGDLLLNEVLLQWDLNAQGYTLGIEPEMKCSHINEYSLRSICIGYFHWNRCFGENRARHYQWSWPKRLAFVLGLPAQPLLRAARIGLTLRRTYPQDMPQYWRSLPVILAAQACASAGIGLGILLGAGDSPQAFTTYEVSERRADERPNA